MKMKNKISIIVFALIISLSMTACDNGTDSGDYEIRKLPSGTYLGVIGFNEELMVREIRYLSEGNRAQFQSFVSRMDLGLATGLYYAIDKAIDNLLIANLPDDIRSVTLITFTDGIDDDSTAFNPNYETQEDYLEAIKERIAETEIGGLNINAHAIGIKSLDVLVTDPEFLERTRSLASVNSNAVVFTNITDIFDRFIDIANGLYDNQEEGSDVIMLVLDCTTSLEENRANWSFYMKDAVYNFINTLLGPERGGADVGTDTETAALLLAGQWREGNVQNANSIDYYKVNVIAGVPYYFWWEESDTPIPGRAKTGDVEVSFSSDGENWSSWIDTAWIQNEGFNYPINRTGTLYIRVRPYYALESFAGTYAITYRAYNNLRPH